MKKLDLFVKFVEGVSEKEAKQIFDSLKITTVLGDWDAEQRVLVVKGVSETNVDKLRKRKKVEEIFDDIQFSHCDESVEVEEKKESCADCKKIFYALLRKICFRSHGGILRITVNGGECYECAEKRYFKNLDDTEAENVVRIVKGELLVNWELLLSARRWPKEYRQCYYDELLVILVSLDIFSFEPGGNYEIVDISHHYVMNPKSGFHCLYFMRPQDVSEYISMFMPDAMYDWEIRRIDYVLEKRKAIIS